MRRSLAPSLLCRPHPSLPCIAVKRAKPDSEQEKQQENPRPITKTVIPPLLTGAKEMQAMSISEQTQAAPSRLNVVKKPMMAHVDTSAVQKNNTRLDNKEPVTAVGVVGPHALKDEDHRSSQVACLQKKPKSTTVVRKETLEPRRRKEETTSRPESMRGAAQQEKDAALLVSVENIKVKNDAATNASRNNIEIPLSDFPGNLKIEGEKCVPTTSAFLGNTPNLKADTITPASLPRSPCTPGLLLSSAVSEPASSPAPSLLKSNACFSTPNQTSSAVVAAAAKPSPRPPTPALPPASSNLVLSTSALMMLPPIVKAPAPQLLKESPNAPCPVLNLTHPHVEPAPREVLMTLGTVFVKPTQSQRKAYEALRESFVGLLLFSFCLHVGFITFSFLDSKLKRKNKMTSGHVHNIQGYATAIRYASPPLQRPNAWARRTWREIHPSSKLAPSQYNVRLLDHSVLIPRSHSTCIEDL